MKFILVYNEIGSFEVDTTTYASGITMIRLGNLRVLKFASAQCTTGTIIPVGGLLEKDRPITPSVWTFGLFDISNKRYPSTVEINSYGKAENRYMLNLGESGRAGTGLYSGEAIYFTA